MRYKMKSLTVDAEQWHPRGWPGYVEIEGVVEVTLVKSGGPGQIVGAIGVQKECGLIHERDGFSYAENGDVIVTDAQGNIYPMKLKVFEKAFEPIELQKT